MSELERRMPAHPHRDKRRRTAFGIKRTSERSYRFRWLAHLARLLGHVPDPVLAARAGVHAKTVAKERRRRGIAASTRQRAPIKWTERMLGLLGTDSDANLAAELGLHRGSVSRMRRILGSPPSGPRGATERSSGPRTHGPCSATLPTRKSRAGSVSRKRPSWSRDKRWAYRASAHHTRGSCGGELRLRTIELLKKYGLWPATVVQLRRELGVPRPYVEPHRWTPDAVARLEKETDSAIARYLGITNGSVGEKRHRLVMWEETLAVPMKMPILPPRAAGPLAWVASEHSAKGAWWDATRPSLATPRGRVRPWIPRPPAYVFERLATSPGQSPPAGPAVPDPDAEPDTLFDVADRGSSVSLASNEGSERA